MNTAINILIVDDNAVNQFVAVKMVEKWGMTAHTANDGLEALSKIGMHEFHLILMDLDMPVMDGYESTRRIRLMDGAYFKSVPIIAFTASEIQDAKRKSLEAGMQDLIAKPLQRNELEHMIDRYVANGKGREISSRPLSIDFDQYTDGDEAFKSELVSMLSNDLVELQNGLRESIKINKPELFMKACHKAKTTVSMLNDHEFNHLAEDLEQSLWEQPHSNATVTDKVDHFIRIAAELINGLGLLLQPQTI